jgi:uncharacterized membrane protein YoaK (UPF0700 family)
MVESKIKKLETLNTILAISGFVIGAAAGIAVGHYLIK